jgi:hypothetical protein
VRRLLWEVSRLHDRLTEAYDLLERLEGAEVDYTVGLGLRNLRNSLAAEPAVKRTLAIRKREAARIAAQPKPVIGSAMWDDRFVGPPWPPPRTPRRGRRR